MIRKNRCRGAWNVGGKSGTVGLVALAFVLVLANVRVYKVKDVLL
jgi:hypothetical protein